MEKVVALASNNLISAFVTNEDDVKLSKEEIKENKRFQNIRKQLLKSTLKELGMKEKDLDRYANKFAEYQNNPQRPNQFIDNLRDSENVVNSARTAVKVGDKETAKKIATFGVTVAAFASAKFAAVQALIASISATIPFLGVALGGATLAYYLKKRVKARQGEKSDFSEKDRAFEEYLISMEEKLKNFDKIINQDKDMIIQKSKTMKSAEFKKFIAEYAKQKLTECGLIGELQVEQATAAVDVAPDSTAPENETAENQVEENSSESEEESQEDEKAEEEKSSNETEQKVEASNSDNNQEKLDEEERKNLEEMGK